MELAIILALCLANGVFAAAELALISARRGRLQQQASAGSRRAEAALALQDDPNRLLSTVQVGITLIGTLAGAFGGIGIAAQLSAFLRPWVANSAEPIAFVIVVIAISYFQLVLGELVPKRLALQSAEGIAVIMARPMLVLAAVSRPVISVLTWSTELLLALLGRRSNAASGVTEDDIRQLVREGMEDGALEPQEHALIERVISLGDRNVRQVMTPRHAVSAIDGELPIGSVLDELLAVGFSRFPVYTHQLDQIIGIAHIRDLIRQFRSDPTMLVRTVMRPPLFVPERSRAAALLITFRKDQQHMAIVISELGTVEGVITLEDVLEEIVGEIEDEYDQVEELFVAREDGSYLIDGLAPIERVQQTLRDFRIHEEDQRRFETLAGLVLSILSRMARTGDRVVWGNWTLEVVDLDGLRIDKILATPLPKDHP